MRTLLAIAVALSTPFVLMTHSRGQALQTAAAPAFAEPGISPDGRQIAFVSGGDIWTVAASGGEARLLVSHPAAESRPLYSPDGTRLAFTSTRTGNGDVYVLTLASGDLLRLTFDDAMELVNGWSADGKWIYFSSSGRDISSMNDVYRVSASGGTPMPVAADRYASEYFGAPAPDGRRLAITARGFAGTQWWRLGHSHLDESEIWIVTDGQPPAYAQLTPGGAKSEWPMWGGDGQTLFYMSDRSGAQNIWKQSVGGQPQIVTAFKDGRVLWPSISRDGQTIAFERDLAIWTLSTASGTARQVPITRLGVPAGPAVDRATVSDQFQELALSPDGKKIAMIAHGEVFSASAKDGGDAQRVTFTPGRESQVTWAPDSRRIVYASERGDGTHLYQYDFATGAESALTSAAPECSGQPEHSGVSADSAYCAGFDTSPRFSPDGKQLAFQRNGRELHVLDLATKADRIVSKGVFDTPPFVDPMGLDWSPDSKYIAYFSAGPRMFQNIEIVPVAGGEPRQVSFLANVFSGSLSWSADGTYLVFSTRQRTEPGRVIRIDLVPRTPRFREDQFRDLFKEEAPTRAEPSPAQKQPTPKAPAQNEPAQAKPGTTTQPAAKDQPARDATVSKSPKPVTIDYEAIRRRVSVIPVGLDVNAVVASPDGKWLAFTAVAAGQQNLYVYSLDELSKEPAVARQITSTAGSKGVPQFTSDSKELMYLDRGRVYSVAVDKREPKPIAIDAQMDVDFRAEKMAMFDEAWRWLRDNFFDEKMNGVDWAAERRRYEPFVAAAASPDEARRIISLMIGDLNASHSGISGPMRANETVTGRLGVTFDRAEYESSGRLRISSILPLGPVALVREIKVGDVITGIDGRSLARSTNIDELLQHTINRRVALTLEGGGGSARHVAVRPVDQNTEKGLMYRDWVEQKRAYVERVSGGALGYVHMYDMSADSLNQLFLDLDTQNQSKTGVVVDIRNNNGGFVNVYAIDAFARRGYFSMTYRGQQPTSSRHVLGQRALELPTILVTSQHSLSDAEDFTEGYRSLKLGKVVGEPTAGWIIYTSNQSLIDGSMLRIPFIRITASDGTPMEMHPRPVDIAVTRPMGESYTDKDSQLDAAIAELMKEIGQRTGTGSDGRF